MSSTATMTEKRLWIVLVRLALTLTAVLIGTAVLLELVFESADDVRAISIGAFLMAAGVSILAHGFLALLHIIDWFETRRARKAAQNG